MPFVDAKITVPVSEQKREAIKCGLGEAIGAFGKSEDWLMVGIEDEYALWLGGRKLDLGAFVSVSMVGTASDKGCKVFTQQLCELLEKELGIPGNSVYVTYRSVQGSNWGWNGGTF